MVDWAARVLGLDGGFHWRTDEVSEWNLAQFFDGACH